MEAKQIIIFEEFDRLIIVIEAFLSGMSQKVCFYFFKYLLDLFQSIENSFACDIIRLEQPLLQLPKLLVKLIGYS